MNNIKLVIFDLDGTLIDAYPAINSSFNYVMRKLKLKQQTAFSIRRSVGWGDSNLLKPFVPPEYLSRALKLYRQHHKRSLIKNAYLYTHTKAVLTYLKKEGYKLAVASNRPTVFSLILLKHLCLMRFFDYILCADKLSYGKPHPQILNRIIAKFSLKKSQALYVGDMAIDAEAGRRAGIKTIIVTGGSSSKSQIKKEAPLKIITRLDKLLAIL